MVYWNVWLAVSRAGDSRESCGPRDATLPRRSTPLTWGPRGVQLGAPYAWWLQLGAASIYSLCRAPCTPGMSLHAINIYAICSFKICTWLFTNHSWSVGVSGFLGQAKRVDHHSIER
jgi:hypothetical protein